MQRIIYIKVRWRIEFFEIRCKTEKNKWREAFYINDVRHARHKHKGVSHPVFNINMTWSQEPRAKIQVCIKLSFSIIRLKDNRFFSFRLHAFAFYSKRLIFYRHLPLATMATSSHSDSFFRYSDHSVLEINENFAVFKVWQNINLFVRWNETYKVSFQEKPQWEPKFVVFGCSKISLDCWILLSSSA